MLLRSHWLPLLAIAPLAVSCLAAQAAREPPTEAAATPAFAIVTDAETWRAIPDAIRAYRAAVEGDGLPTWIVADEWSSPESVRDALRTLHDGATGLEGALLVGRVPVALVRGAQHLTTAFKMDEERYPRRRSSVPTDRFYEDFDLVFEPLGVDDDDGRLFYYELAPDSPQRIEKEIYTARLWPPGDGSAAHAEIAACLRRFARAPRGRAHLDRALSLLGHGYISESLVAWADTRAALAEQIPALVRPGGALVSLHHARGPGLERELLRELSDPDYDLALLHSHGDDAVQYLLGSPELPTAQARIEAVQRYLRGRLRRARDRGEDEAETQRALRERFGVPDAWFDGAFDDAVRAADDAAEQLTELVADEVGTITSGAEVVLLDSCFNGNFVAGPYQAAAYLFGGGETAAVVGNSVNVAQDVWSERGLGALAAGARVGAWHREVTSLESHVFGDPTFRFARDEHAASTRALVEGVRDPESSDAELAEILFTSRSATVRLEALAALARRRSAAFRSALGRAARDPAEIVRRRAVDLIGDVGQEDDLPALLGAVLRDPSERVVFCARGALRKYAREAVADALQASLDALPPGAVTDDRDALLRSVQASDFLDEYLARARDPAQPADKRASALRTFRLYRAHPFVTPLIELARTADERDVRVSALEALGWFVYSKRRAVIEAAAADLAGDAEQPEAVRAMAAKTLARLRAGANDPLLP